MRIIPIKMWRIGYFLFGKYYPCSYKSNLSKLLRNFWASRIVESVGENINVERGAQFACNIVLGNNSGLGINCDISGPVVIGDNVMMGPEVVIYTTNHEHDRIDVPMIEQGIAMPRKVTIGDDVWIGRRVIILPGVTIGRGSIIGAGAVVAKDIPPYSVAVGNPARVVKARE